MAAKTADESKMPGIKVCQGFRNNESYEGLYKDLISEIFSFLESKGFSGNNCNNRLKAFLGKLKQKLSKKHNIKGIATDISIYLNAILLLCSRQKRKYGKKTNALGKKELSILEALRQAIQTKPVRSLSGVSVVAVMASPEKCPHGKCITCPGGPCSSFGDVPQSYTGTEPATRRAIRNNYDPYLQVFNRLEQYYAAGHNARKVELIIMGGTFPARKRSYQLSFVAGCFKALNDFSSLFFRKGSFLYCRFLDFFELPADITDAERERRLKKKLLKLKRSGPKLSLEELQKKNEKAELKCIGLTIETRPDYGMLEHGNFMLRLGCTRVELGIQSVYDKSLEAMNRGHSSKDSTEAIKALKDLGFKINIHYMPGLFVSEKKDLEGMKMLFSDPDYRPDMLKIYPCMVLKGTQLYDLWLKGLYKPLSTKAAAKLIARFKQYVPEYCRIMRVQRDIPSTVVEAGVKSTNIRQYIKSYLDKSQKKCMCIRCREIKDKKVQGKPKLKEISYSASDGKEHFISIVDNKSLLGFCRLRFPSKALRPELKNAAIVRELHVYGAAAEFGKKAGIQHTGLGKRLLKRAEEIAKANDAKRIAVISGVGVRGYYRKLGYRKLGMYMAKKLS